MSCEEKNFEATNPVNARAPSPSALPDPPTTWFWTEARPFQPYNLWVKSLHEKEREAAREAREAREAAGGPRTVCHEKREQDRKSTATCNNMSKWRNAKVLRKEWEIAFASVDSQEQKCTLESVVDGICELSIKEGRRKTSSSLNK